MPRILYIAGAAHCGSTLLDIMLGAAPQVCNVGQLADLHKQTANPDTELEDDSFWSSVLDAPGMPRDEDLARWGMFIREERGLPRVLASISSCRRYARVQDRIFQSVFQVSGAHTVVDSSKNMTRAVALLRGSRYDVRVLHLVRDPRGYINSNNKRRREASTTSSFAPAMLYWLLKNSVASLLVRPIARQRYCGISYENLLLHPERTLTRIGRFASIDVSPIIARIHSRTPFEPRRIFSGNRISQKRAVVFDPSRVTSNRLRGMDERTFWYTLGWPSAFWGYDMHPSYHEQRAS